MDPSTLFSVAPTFPVDDARLRELRWKRILSSPVTIGAVVLAGALGFGLGAGLMGFMALYAGAALGMRSYWEKNRSKLDAACLKELIEESNEAQDNELRRIIGELNVRSLPQYAVCLSRFLILKQKIERELHGGPHLSAFAMQIEKAVDGICKEVCLEITRLKDREQDLGEVLTSREPARLEALEAARRQSQAAILHAYTSLYQTHAGLIGLDATAGTRAKMPVAKEAAPGERLNQILGDLKDEADLIVRTRARIQESLGESSSTASPRMAEHA